MWIISDTFQTFEKAQGWEGTNKAKSNCSPVFDLVLARSPAYNVILEIQKYKVSYIGNTSINVNMIAIRVFES